MVAHQRCFGKGKIKKLRTRISDGCDRAAKSFSTDNLEDNMFNMFGRDLQLFTLLGPVCDPIAVYAEHCLINAYGEYCVNRNDSHPILRSLSPEINAEFAFVLITVAVIHLYNDLQQLWLDNRQLSLMQSRSFIEAGWGVVPSRVFPNVFFNGMVEKKRKNQNTTKDNAIVFWFILRLQFIFFSENK